MQARLSEHPGCNSHCGACHYKELTYDEQLSRKQNWAASQLAPLGAELRQIIPSPPHERMGYRTKSWLQTHFDDGGVSFGMYRAKRIDGKWDQEFISWNTCPLHSNGINETVIRLQKAFLCLDTADQATARREWAGVWLGLPHVVIVSKLSRSSWVDRLSCGEIITPPFTQAWFHKNTQIGRRIFGHEPIELLHPAEDTSTPTTHPIRAFRQVAQTLLKDARDSAVSFLLDAKPSAVVDLYCGTGDLSLLLPASVNWVGIEHSSAAVIYAKSLKLSHRQVHEAFEGSVEDRIVDPRFLSTFERDTNLALFINPPRTGLGEKGQARIVSFINRYQPQRIAYLSCSASSLSRDLAPLKAAGYVICSLTPYDFFPQTQHFETLVLLGRDDPKISFQRTGKG